MNSPIQTEWSGRHVGKDLLRSEVWSRLVEQEAAIGKPFGHIPNFKGVDQAAERLAGLSIWQQARVIKSNPDSPQQPVRWRALQDGKKTLYGGTSPGPGALFCRTQPDSPGATGYQSENRRYHQRRDALWSPGLFGRDGTD